MIFIFIEKYYFSCRNIKKHSKHRQVLRMIYEKMNQFLVDNRLYLFFPFFYSLYIKLINFGLCSYIMRLVGTLPFINCNCKDLNFFCTIVCFIFLNYRCGAHWSNLLLKFFLKFLIISRNSRFYALSSFPKFFIFTGFSLNGYMFVYVYIYIYIV